MKIENLLGLTKIGLVLIGNEKYDKMETLCTPSPNSHMYMLVHSCLTVYESIIYL